MALHAKGTRGAWAYRLWEIIPGLASWLFLLSPVALSFFDPQLAAYVIIAYFLFWVAKVWGQALRLLRGYARMHRTERAEWSKRLDDLADPEAAITHVTSRIKGRDVNWHKKVELRQYRAWLRQISGHKEDILDPGSIYNVAMVTLSIEPIEVIEPTIQSILASHYDMKQLWLVIAYEARIPGGEAVANKLIARYGRQFGYAVAVKHPANIPGEAVAKAGNVTYAAKYITRYIKTKKIDPTQVIITTLDADNRPSPQYFAYLTFMYASIPSRIHKSYQPLPMFLNNIWDAPAPMRVIATGNSFWQVMEAMRPHRLRNFSSHAQSLQTLIDSDYWNVESIVEDGHQFWRTYYAYHGEHKVVPLYVPIYQDAVLAGNFRSSLKAQFKQLQRWAWGASDISFVFMNNLKHPEIHWPDKWNKFFRLFEGHFSWATSALILTFAAWAPLLLNPGFSNDALAHQLPIIASRIQQIATVGILTAVFVSFVTLPPRPARYRRHRTIFMLAQWALLPFTTIFVHSIAALNAQTRLLLGRYIVKFNITQKAIKK